MKPPRYSSWLWICFKIGGLSFGSASRTILFEEAVVRDEAWMNEDEFQEALTLAQILPGPNLVNLATCLGHRLFSPLRAGLAVLLLIVPGALLVILAALWIPLERPGVAELFRGFAIGAFLLMGRFLWNLWRGIASSPGLASSGRKRWGRYALVLGFSGLSFYGTPVLPLVLGGACVCLAWEFLPERLS